MVPGSGRAKGRECGSGCQGEADSKHARMRNAALPGGRAPHRHHRTLPVRQAQSVAVSLETTWPQRQYDVITATLAEGTTHVFEGRGLTEVAGELAAVTVTTPQA